MVMISSATGKAEEPAYATVVLLAVAGAVELRNDIGRRIGCDLPGTLVFDYPTAAAITEYLVDRMIPTLSSAGTQDALDLVETLVPAAGPLGEADQLLVVIAGMCSRLAQLPSADLAWPSSNDTIRCVPYDRWDVEFSQSTDTLDFDSGTKRSLSSGPTLSGRFGGFVLDWATFDSEAFAIAPSGTASQQPARSYRLDQLAAAVPTECLCCCCCCCRGGTYGPSAAAAIGGSFLLAAER